jgi:predicted kinase
MQAVIFVGLQGAGKSTFYKRRFFSTHMRINLDMLNTRNREQKLFQACIDTLTPVVVDNTNPTRDNRRVYIEPAKAAGFRVIGYYFQSKVDDCKRRNAERVGSEQVPMVAILGTAGRMEIPKKDEGFEELYYVRIDDAGGFVIEEWKDEV